MQLIAWTGIVVAFLATIWGRIIVAAARDHVQQNHPRAFDSMSDYGTPFLKDFSGKESRVARALAGRMLTGRLPREVKDDPVMVRVIYHWRIAALIIATGFTAAILTIGKVG